MCIRDSVSWDKLQSVTISGDWELGFCAFCKIDVYKRQGLARWTKSHTYTQRTTTMRRPAKPLPNSKRTQEAT